MYDRLVLGWAAGRPRSYVVKSLTMPQVAGWESCGEANTINGVGVDLVAGGLRCWSDSGSARRKGGG
jgi:hypothetical protein